MDETLIVQGRRLDGPELEKLRDWVSDRAAWSRRHLLVELATQWEWRNGAGQLACPVFCLPDKPLVSRPNCDTSLCHSWLSFVSQPPFLGRKWLIIS